jgi:hypothetical protein
MFIQSQSKFSPLGALLTVYLDKGPGWPAVKEKWLTCSCKLELQLLGRPEDKKAARLFRAIANVLPLERC